MIYALQDVDVEEEISEPLKVGFLAPVHLSLLRWLMQIIVKLFSLFQVLMEKVKAGFHELVFELSFLQREQSIVCREALLKGGRSLLVIRVVLD